MKKRILALLLTASLLSGCSAANNEIINSLLSPNETYTKHEITDSIVRDYPDLYETYSSPDIKILYLTAGYGNRNDNTDHTWDQVARGLQSDHFEEEQILPSCEAIVQFGDENGPVEGEFGFGELTPNATIRLQGTASAGRDQKNYKITVKDGMGKLDGMKEFSLSKSFTDPLRITNKLMFELMTEVPGMLSTRTQLVQLYVKDLSDPEESDNERSKHKFEDYGLYTLIEPVNKAYLKNRGIDTSGDLYEAVNFDFGRHADVILPATDARYDKESFEQLLDPKGTVDHEKLIEMLDAVNDETVSIKETIGRYFDKENLYSFLAFHLLTGNQKNALKDFFIYSPTGSSKFYFVSWDNEAAFKSVYKRIRDAEYSDATRAGIFAYNESKLFSRIFTEEDTLSELSSYVDLLFEQYLTADKVAPKLQALTEAAKPIVFSLPDRNYVKVNVKNYDRIAEQIVETIEENYYTYYDTIEGAWPFHLLKPATNSGKLTLNWEDSYCSLGDVRYTVEVDRGWKFEMPVVFRENVEDNFITIDTLPAGEYFLRVTAVAPDGRTTPAIENYYTEKKTTAYGVLCFYVTSDGKAVASYVENQE